MQPATLLQNLFLCPLPALVSAFRMLVNSLQRAREFQESGIINEQEYLRMREGILTGDEEITGALSSFLKEWDHEFE